MELKALKNGYECLVIENKWLGKTACEQLLDIVTDKKQLDKLVKLLEKVIGQDAPSNATRSKANKQAELIAQIVAQAIKASKE